MIENGVRGVGIDETRRAIVGSVFNFTCNDTYVAAGEFSDRLSTECLENGSYSPLATCVKRESYIF